MAKELRIVRTSLTCGLPENSFRDLPQIYMYMYVFETETLFSKKQSLNQFIKILLLQRQITFLMCGDQFYSPDIVSVAIKVIYLKNSEIVQKKRNQN